MEYKLTEKTKKPIAVSREEIENIIKEKNIDRSRFSEFSKYKYHDIIRKFYYNFSDYRRFVSTTVTLTHKRLHIRDSISCFSIAGIYNTGSWSEYLKKIKSELPLNTNEKLFLILSDAWVYEGYADEIFKVLDELYININDFFIISKKFDWFIVHDYIDFCSFIYKK